MDQEKIENLVNAMQQTGGTRKIYVLFYWDKLKPKHINSQAFNDRYNAEVVEKMRAIRFHTKIIETTL